MYPAIDRCPRCLDRFDGEAVLVEADRAYLCPACGPSGARVSSGALAFLRAAAGRTPVAVTEQGAPVAVLRELEQAHQRLIAAHLEKSLRSVRVVKELGSDL